jgi:hypothetical protein
MATKSKADKGRPFEAETGESVVAASAEAPAVEVVAESLSEPVTDVVAEITDMVQAPLAVIEEAVETATENFAASFKLDSSTFTQKSMELWSENADAFFDFIEKIARAKSFEEAVELQTRFATERLDVLLRQSKELMETARNMASLSAAPLCATKKAA